MIEKIILKVLQELTNKKVSVNKTFIEVNVDSIMFIRFIIRIEEIFSIDLDDEFALCSNNQNIEDFIKNLKIIINEKGDKHE